MNAVTPGAEDAANSPGRRYKRRVLDHTDGSRFVLNVDGSIDHVPGDGSAARTWSPNDPQWAQQALRFGLQPQAPTLTPSGRHIENLEPRR
jgi:hypothetical protein